jgi:hypothetical protein
VARIASLLLVLAGVPALVAACAFDGRIAVHVSRGAGGSVEVTESFTVEQEPGRVSGRATHVGQVVAIDCVATIFYDVNEATGSAVLTQVYRVRLRTPPLPKGTPYDVSCEHPLIVELPSGATGIRAAAETKPGGRSVPLPTR